jgi:hypothetical protein
MDEGVEVEVELDYNPGGLISYKEPQFYINGKDYKSAIAPATAFSRIIDEAMKEMENATSIDDFAARSRFKKCNQRSKPRRAQIMDKGILGPNELLEDERKGVWSHANKANKVTQITRSLKKNRKRLQYSFVRR